MKKLVILMALFLLANCSSFKSEDNTLRPTPLTGFSQEIKVTKLWSTHAGANKARLVSLKPVIQGNTLYTATDQGRIVAIDTKQNKPLWQVKLRSKLSSGPVLGNDLLIVTTDEAEVIALRQKDGQSAWHAELPNEILAAPRVIGNYVLVKAVDGVLQALSLKDGNKIWEDQHGAPNLILRGSSSPEAAGGQVIAGFSDGQLVALSLNSGKLLWQRNIAEPRGATDVERMVDIDASPVINRGRIYVATYQGLLAALTLREGETLWQHKVSAYQDIAVDNNKIYVTDTQSRLWAFRNYQGSVSWKQLNLRGRHLTSPVVMKDIIVVGDAEGYVHCLAKSDGHLVARIFVNRSGIGEAPVVKDNRLYVLANNGELVAYNLF